jgi:NAD(P)H-dependent FMN reductase
MHITLVSGSHRQNSQSLRITKYLAARLPVLDVSATTDIIELTGNPIPFWDDDFWKPGSDRQKMWEPYSKRLQAADGLVITSPEWHGMVPAGLKNFFLYAGVKEIGHKPGLITTVSVSRNGAYPVDELRISSYKNSRFCYIPENLIVRDAANMFVGDAPASKDDEFLRDRADYALRLLLDYAKALKAVRENPAIHDKKYSTGM